MKSAFNKNIIGIGSTEHICANGFIEKEECGDGLWRKGHDGIRGIFSPKGGNVDFLSYDDKTLAYVTSSMGYPAMYPLHPRSFAPPAKAVLMDLDGTSVHSESFWIRVIECTTARLLNDNSFRIVPEDIPHISGHSVSEHLSYCIEKYCPDFSIEEARDYYFEITRHEIQEINEGRGWKDAFIPAPGLKRFLTTLKQRTIKIALVTSGLLEKAWPEIVAAFREMDLGDPNEFYDAIISAGTLVGQGKPGTLGELEPKPHPWLYAEAARIGLGIEPSERNRVIGIEDSGAGIISIRLAGFTAIGIGGGNIEASGVMPLTDRYFSQLCDALPYLTGGKYAF